MTLTKEVKAVLDQVLYEATEIQQNIENSSVGYKTSIVDLPPSQLPTPLLYKLVVAYISTYQRLVEHELATSTDQSQTIH